MHLHLPPSLKTGLLPSYFSPQQTETLVLVTGVKCPKASLALFHRWASDTEDSCFKTSMLEMTKERENKYRK